MTKEQILQYYQQDYIDGLVNKYPEVEITTLIQLNIEIKALYFKYVAMVELFLKGFLTKQLFIDQTTEDVEVISTFISDQKKVIKYLKSINIPNYKKLNKAQ